MPFEKCAVALVCGIRSVFVALWIAATCGTLSAQWIDDFDSYPVGSVDGQGLWVDFGGSLIPEVSDRRANSGSKSLRLAMNPTAANENGIFGYGSDVFVDLPTALDSGKWIMSYQLFVDPEFNGTAFAFFSEGTITEEDFDHGMELNIEGTAETDLFIFHDGFFTVATPLVRDEWVEIVSTIDFDNNELVVSYGGDGFVSRDWDPNPDSTDDDAPLDIPVLGGFNLWAQGGTRGAVYFDDFSIVPVLVPEPSSLQLVVVVLLGIFLPLRRCY